MAQKVKPRTRTLLEQSQDRSVRGKGKINIPTKKILIIEDDPVKLLFDKPRVVYGARRGDKDCRYIII